MTIPRPKRVVIYHHPEPSELSSEGSFDDENMGMPPPPENSDTSYGSDDDGCTNPDEACLSSIDHLSSLHRMCSDFGYHSLLAAALEEAKSHNLCDSSAPKGYIASIRKDLDELCRTYLELGVFSKCPKAINARLGNGACALSLPILLHQFDKIRRHDLFNKSPNVGTAGFHTSFDLPQIYEAFVKVSPQFSRVITSMLNTSESNTPEAQRLVVMISAMLANARSSHSNYIQKVVGMYLYALKTPKRVIASLNHIGLSVSYLTLLRDLRDAADTARNRLRTLGSKGLAIIPVFDNLTFKAKVRQERIDNQAEFMTFMAGYVLVPPTMRSPPMFDRQRDIIQDNIHTLQMTDFLRTNSDHQNIGLVFRAII